MVGAQKSVVVNYSGIQESERKITQDGQTVNIKVARAGVGVKANAPVFIFIHGGGWVLSDYPHRRLVRDLVVGSGAVAVFPDYTPSPEAKYPVAINQIYAATKWVAEHGG